MSGARVPRTCAFPPNMESSDILHRNPLRYPLLLIYLPYLPPPHHTMCVSKGTVRGRCILNNNKTCLSAHHLSLHGQPSSLIMRQSMNTSPHFMHHARCTQAGHPGPHITLCVPLFTFTFMHQWTRVGHLGPAYPTHSRSHRTGAAPSLPGERGRGAGHSRSTGHPSSPTSGEA